MFFVINLKLGVSIFMPTTKFQKIIFAFLSVIISVHCFVFYNIAIEMGGMSNSVFLTAKNVILIEFIFAFLLEIFIAEPLSLKMAFKKVNPMKDKPYVVTTAIICSTVCLMCPMMSFIATVLYNGINSEFLSNWMQKLIFNFPFAFFVELFFVQPLVRTIFKILLKNKKVSAEKGLVQNLQPSSD